jgi:hypothetical protein
MSTSGNTRFDPATSLEICNKCCSQLPKGVLHLSAPCSDEYHKKLRKHAQTVVGAAGRPSAEKLQALQDQQGPAVTSFCHAAEKLLREVGPAAAATLIQDQSKEQAGHGKASAAEPVEPVAEQGAGVAGAAGPSSQAGKLMLDKKAGRAQEVFSRLHVRCVEMRKREQEVSGSWVQAVCTSRCLEAAAAESPQADELRRTMMPCLKSKDPKSELLDVEVLTLVFLAEDDEGLLIVGFAELFFILPHAEVPGLCGAGTHTVLHYFETTGVAPIMDGVRMEGALRRAFSEGILVSLAGALRELGAATLYINPSPAAVSVFLHLSKLM